MAVDVNFIVDSQRFNYRVAAYIRCKDKILLQYSKKEKFYNFIGGRAKMGESSKEAIIREIKEEIGFNIVNAKLMIVAEMFFDWLGKSVQEIVYVYKVDIDEHLLEDLNNTINLDADDEIIELVNFKDLKNKVCKPEFIYDLENFNEETITHLILRK